jgi:hypothetical protein
VSPAVTPTVVVAAPKAIEPGLVFLILLASSLSVISLFLVKWAVGIVASLPVIQDQSAFLFSGVVLFIFGWGSIALARRVLKRNAQRFSFPVWCAVLAQVAAAPAAIVATLYLIRSTYDPRTDAQKAETKEWFELQSKLRTLEFLDRMERGRRAEQELERLRKERGN